MGLKIFENISNNIADKVADKLVNKVAGGDYGIPNSGGNTFNTKQRLDVQEQIDLATIPTLTAYEQEQIINQIRKETEKYLQNKTYNVWFLLNFQGDYFCNTCRFKTNNMKIFHAIKKVIRGAFLYGMAALYNDNGVYKPVYITEVKESSSGVVYSLKYTPLNIMFNQQNLTPHNSKFIKVSGAECLKFHIFRWGTLGLGAYITLYPFVNIQNSLLKQIIIRNFLLNKKIEYNVVNLPNTAKEIKNFFDENNPFIIKLSAMSTTDASASPSLFNRFKIGEVEGNNGIDDYISYYKEVIGIYYNLFGRRMNEDIKKERNVSTEIEATQEQYDYIQNEWLEYFEMFINSVKYDIEKDVNLELELLCK